MKISGRAWVLLLMAISTACGLHTTNKRQTEFALACISGEPEKVRKLIESERVELDATNGRIGPCLVSAAYGGHREIALLLLTNGANIDVRDQKGGTPLANAVVGDKYEMVELLLRQGADPNIILPDKDGQLTDITALKIARAKGNNRIINLLEKYEKEDPSEK